MGDMTIGFVYANCFFIEGKFLRLSLNEKSDLLGDWKAEKNQKKLSSFVLLNV